MRCRECGRETGDRHAVCFRCKRGLPSLLVDERSTSRARPRNLAPLVCVCARSRPEPVGGVFDAISAKQCAKCGRAVL